MKNNGRYIINIPIAKVFKNANVNSNLETELLFGDAIKIIDKKNDWIFCKNLADQYKGWIDKEVIGSLPKNSHYINKLNSIVFSEPNIKSTPLFNLTYNSKVLVNFLMKDGVKLV